MGLKKQKQELETKYQYAVIGLALALVLAGNYIPGSPILGKLDGYLPFQAASPGGQQTSPQMTLPQDTQAACAETPNPTGAFRAIDENAATTTYLNGDTVNILNGGTLSSTTTNQSFSVTKTLACGTAYNAYLMPTAGSSNGHMMQFVAQPANANNLKTFKTSQFTGIEAKIYDEEGRAYLASGTDQGWQELSASWDNDSSLSGDLAIGADGYYDLSLELRANNTKEVFEGAKEECYLVVDADPDKWDEPATVEQDGRNLIGANALGDHFDSNDAAALSGYEYAYKLNGGIEGGAGTSVRYYQTTADGINPTSSNNVLLRVVCKDYVVDDNNPDAIRYGAFNTDSSFTEIVGSSYVITLSNT